VHRKFIKNSFWIKFINPISQRITLKTLKALKVNTNFGIINSVITLL